MMKIKIEAGQIQGKRDYQQDAYGYRELSETAKIFILADGMGGYKGGEIASDLVLQTFMQKAISPTGSEELMEVVKEANEKIKIHKVGANRMINSKGSGRGKIKEVLVINY